MGYRSAISINPCKLATFAFAIVVITAPAATNFVNFETAPVHPIALSPDGRTLAICNLPDNRVEFFDVSTGVPAPTGSVPVGLDPVSVRFASTNEVWVINTISSTISIVDVPGRRIVATVETLPGPSDLVFAGTPQRAWVSCSRSNAVLVINAQTRSVVTNIAIGAERPRAMAVSPDGSKVYVAIFESGNGTTVIGRRLTGLSTPAGPGPVDDPNGPYGGRNPPPNSGTNFFPAIRITNTPPPVSLIVRRSSAGHWMDDNNGDWTQWVSGTNAASSGRIPGWDLPDRDVAIIDTSTLEVRYANRLMNICMALGVNPVSGEIAVVGTDATNERRFEPVLNGIFLRVNLALVDPVTRTNRIRDLNPHLNYITRTLSQEQRALSIADPRGIEWNSAGTRAYITGMGSGNLVIIDVNGSRVNPQPIEVDEGPTGMALDEPRARLYVWNRFSSTISVLNTTSGSVITNVPVFDPTPEIIRKGRPQLYDARKTSGLGITACASCHIDGRADHLAWDLGKPDGDMVTNRFAPFHPMKGPIITQTLQDIITPFLSDPPFFTNVAEQSLHWRADRTNLEAFNQTFTNLQANDVTLTTNEMADFKGMLATIFFPPNPLRTLSNQPLASIPLPGLFGPQPTNGGPRSPLPPGNWVSGQALFNNQTRADCVSCHIVSDGGRSKDTAGLFIGSTRTAHESTFKIAQLRSLVDKIGMDSGSTNSLAGFGFMHDGRVDTLTRFLTDGFPTSFDAANLQNIADMVAFLLVLPGTGGHSQDVPGGVGRQVTFDSPSPPPPVQAMLDAMLNVARTTGSGVEFVVRGKKDGRPRSWLLRRQSNDFQSDRHGEIAPTFSDVIAPAAPGNEFTAMLVPQGSGVRIALDRDGDGFFDTWEIESGTNPADPTSYPFRIVSISRSATTVTLTWESVPGRGYLLQFTPTLTASNTWNDVGQPIVADSQTTTRTDAPPSNASSRFYRIRNGP